MFNISRETYKGNDIETIVDIDGILLFLYYYNYFVSLLILIFIRS